jgi:hypothetical protein
MVPGKGRCREKRGSGTGERRYQRERLASGWKRERTLIGDTNGEISRAVDDGDRDGMVLGLLGSMMSNGGVGGVLDHLEEHESAKGRDEGSARCSTAMKPRGAGTAVHARDSLKLLIDVSKLVREHSLQSNRYRRLSSSSPPDQLLTPSHHFGRLQPSIDDANPLLIHLSSLAFVQTPLPFSKLRGQGDVLLGDDSS